MSNKHWRMNVGFTDLISFLCLGGTENFFNTPVSVQASKISRKARGVVLSNFTLV